MKNLTKGQVEFKNVSFRYPSRKNYVMRRLNLVIKPNTSVALVGPSGSGKSTIASLLLRFYDPQHGKILIDNKELKSYDLPYLRKYLTIVMQEPLLFNETIKDNILYGDQLASDQKVREISIKTNSLPFIMQTEEDFNSQQVRTKIQ